GVVAEQVFAQRFGAVQGGRFARVAAAVVGQCRARGRKGFFVVRAHQFGQVRELALVRDVRRRALHFGQLIAHVVWQFQLGQPRRRQLRQLLCERQHVQRFAAACAAAGAFVLLFFPVLHGGASQGVLNEK